MSPHWMFLRSFLTIATSIFLIVFAFPAFAYCLPGQRCIEQPGRVFVPQNRPQVFRQPNGQFRAPGVPGFRQGRMAQRPMVQGRFGWHPQRNQSPIAIVSGIISGSPVNTEQFIQSIDLSQPPMTVDACVNCIGPFAAISVASDRASSSTFNAPDAQAAQAGVYQGCMASSITRDCGPAQVVFGSQWIVAAYCNNGALQSGFTAGGNDGEAALTNVFRFIAQAGIFSPLNDCEITNLIAADGSTSPSSGISNRSFPPDI